MTAAVGSTDRPADPVRSTYRPHLDGLRAVAVYLVVGFHASINRFSGGFIGVDVFFVLSGYLVTQLLLRDVDGRGSIDLPRFYARRFRRLLPAAAFTLIATVVVFGVIAPPAQVVAAEDAVRAAALYFANWFYIGQSNDYFAGDVQGSPVLHFWSLSVEEQYYVTWPLLLGGLLLVTKRAGGRQRSIVRGVVATAMLASLVAALWIARTDVNRAYYGTDTRAYQLLAGSLLALAPGVVAWVVAATAGPRRIAVRLAPPIAMVGLIVIATSWVAVGAITRGVLATVATLVLIVSLEASAGPVRTLLSLTPVVYLGRISYATYLWHWIVILVIGATLEVSPIATAVGTTFVATGLASLSYQVLEMPVRESRWLDRRKMGVVAAGLATSALVGLVVGPMLIDSASHHGRPRQATAGSGGTPVPPSLDWESALQDTGDYPTCRASKLEGCTLVEAGDLRVMLIGDSNAKMYLSMFEALAREQSFTFQAAVTPGCYWIEGIQRTDPRYDRTCRATQREWYDEIVPALDPDIVFVAHRAIDDAASPIPVQDEETGELAPDSDAFRRAMAQRVESTVDQLRAQGRKVVIIEPAPVTRPALNPLDCLSQADFLDECQFATANQASITEEIERSTAELDPDVWTLDLDRLMCPSLPICDPVVDGLIVRWDHAHITQTFSRSLEPAFREIVLSQGILSDG